MAKKNVEANYSVEVAFCSRELTAKERVMVKDTTDAMKLDRVTAEDAIVIKPDWYATLKIHNEKADDVDYENFLIVDEDGMKYVTGSHSFMSSFKNIFDEMKDCNEDWAIKIYQVDSKNYAGKKFITCSIV